MQGLTDLWRRSVPHIPLFHFGMPLRLDSPSARVYLLAELQSLRERVQAMTGRPISDGMLRESIALYNRTRALVRRLYARAARGDIAPPDLYALVRAAFQMPKETYNQEIGSREQGAGSRKQGAGSVKQAAGCRMQDVPPLPPCPPAPLLLLVGLALADTVLFDVIAQATARVVGDLLDLGERYFAVDAAEDGDPLAALADRLLALVPTPTKYHPQRTRAVHLLSLVRERSADGVIFARQKFCEPHGFDYVQLAHALDRAGVPHLLVELEQASQAGQLRTRVEAFVEMLA